VALVLPLISHSCASVRSAVASALTGQDDESAITGLIRLSSDPDEDVRHWATSGLARTDADSTAIRAALFAGLDDSSANARNEAIHALAARQDSAVLPFLARQLAGPRPHAFLADARQLADPALCPALLQGRDNDFGRSPFAGDALLQELLERSKRRRRLSTDRQMKIRAIFRPHSRASRSRSFKGARSGRDRPPLAKQRHTISARGTRYKALASSAPDTLSQQGKAHSLPFRAGTATNPAPGGPAFPM